VRLKGSVAVLVMLAILTGSVTLSVAQEQEDACFLLVKTGETYYLELDSITGSEQHSLTLGFDSQAALDGRLKVQVPYTCQYDDWTHVYRVQLDTAMLCEVSYKGLDNVLLGEERARLEVRSNDYHVRLVRIQVEQDSVALSVPESFRIVLVLCSLVPFFLLVPDAVEELQQQLELEASSKGVYGRILALLLPLLSIALTLLLLEGLQILG